MTTDQGTWYYTYDAQSQLTSWTNPDGVTTKARYPSCTFPEADHHKKCLYIFRCFCFLLTQVTYDKNQNRRSISVGNDELGYEINQLNQYTSLDTRKFEYDLNGNLVEILDEDSGYKQNHYFNPEGKVSGYLCL